MDARLDLFHWRAAEHMIQQRPAEFLRSVSLASVQQEFNGFPFDPDFENWKSISTTDRGDNNTFRFILGNDIAIKAAQSGNISPWPDGTRFAKIAWLQQLGHGWSGPPRQVRTGRVDA